MAIADSIIGVESGGDPEAKNPNSSATGAGQFVSGTWLDMLAKHRPDITGSPDELLALRNDPKLSAEMTAAYAGDNQAILKKNGLPVTDGTTYLAHFAGPQGAVKVLQADPNAMVSDILDKSAIKANPFLQGMTAQGLQAWAARKMGVSSPVPQSPSASPAGPANAPAPPLNLAPSAPPVFAQQPQAQPQQQAEPAAPFQMPAQQPLAPIFAPRRAPVNLANLRAAFSAPTFPRG